MPKQPLPRGRTAQLRIFEISQVVSGFIKCETIDDLSSQMQDQIYAALEHKSREVELPLAIVLVRCDVDHDATDPRQKFFLHVVASEVVMADERTIDPLRLLQ